MVEELIVRGTEQVREEVRNTVLEMKKLMGLSGVYMRISRKAERYLKKQDK
jgi:tryptophanyl-tRNA synthetase